MARKIKIPENMSVLQMNTAGIREKNSFDLTDKQLGEQMAALALVISFFTGSGNAGIILGPLRMRLSSLTAYKEARERG